MLTVAKKTGKPLVSFNPAGFKRARKSYDSGAPAELIQMMKEAGVDSHVAGCLSGRRSGYKRAFTLTAFDDTESDAQRRDWFKGVLQRLRLRDLLEAIHEGRLYLYHVVDFAWEVVDGRQVPTSFEAFDQHYFRYDKEGILKIAFGNELREIPETALVVENNKTPVMLPPLRDYIMKEFGLEAWSHFLENFGEPFIMGKYPANSGPEFKDEVEAGVKALAASARGTAPEGTELEIHESSRTAGDHLDYTKRCDDGIAIALLGHANAVQNSSGLQVGQNLTPYQVRFDIAVDDCYFIEPFVDRIIQLIGDQNFGDGRYPRFELDKSKPINALEYTRMCREWFDMNGILSPREMEKCGLLVSEDQQPMQKAPGQLSTILGG